MVCMFGKRIKESLVLVIAIAIFFATIAPAAALDIQQPASAVPAQDAVALPHVIASRPGFSIPFFNTSLRDMRLQAARNYGVNGVDQILNALGVAKVQIQGSRLPENEKIMLVSEIDSNITWFESKKSDIMSASDLATVRSIGKDVNDRWNSEKVDIKRQAGDIACDQYEANIAEARNASSIAAGKINAIKAQGKDTSAMEKKLASYNSHVNDAANNLGNARTEFDQINGPTLADVHFSVGLRQLRLAGNEMNSSYSDLRDLYGMIYRNSTSSNAIIHFLSR